MYAYLECESTSFIALHNENKRYLLFYITVLPRPVISQPSKYHI